MLKHIDPIQLFILLLLAVILIVALVILFRQALRQRRLMKKREPIDRDIRERKATTWPTDFQALNK